MLVRDLSIAESKLNAEGEKGWELISVCLIDSNSARCFFKMEVEGADGAAVSDAAHQPAPATFSSTQPLSESMLPTGFVPQDVAIAAGRAPFE
jgi:hypothetical protein